MTATTSSNGATWHQTTVAGTLTKNGVSLGRDSRNGETKAVLQEAGANGYLDGSGIHKAGYRNSTWNGNTNL